MPQSAFLLAILLCADPTEPIVVVVAPAERMPATTKTSAAMPPESVPANTPPAAATGRAAETPRNLPPAATAPSVKRQQGAMISQLRAQAALREARRLLAEGKADAAISELEPQVANANGSEDFLEVLDQAYDRRVAQLIREHRSEEAQLLSERREAIAPKGGRKPVEAAAAAAEDKSPVLAELASGARTNNTPEATPAKGTRKEGEIPQAVPARGKDLTSMIGGLFGKASKKDAAEPPAKNEYIARGKIDDRDPAASLEMSRDRQTNDPLEKAHSFYRKEQFKEALASYEAAYQADPNGRIQDEDSRNRYGYCLLRVAYEKYNNLTSSNESNVDAKCFDEWEKDIQLGRQLVVVRSYQKFADQQLELLKARRDKVASFLNGAASRNAGNAESSSNVDVSFHHLGASGNGWMVTETQNFRIEHQDRALAEEVAGIAERARHRSNELWFPKEQVSRWPSKCVIKLYPSREEFAQSNPEMPNSPANTKCDVRPNYVVASRRIELRADEPTMKGAILPHEITHAVLAGRFAGNSPPRWADEGFAVLTEPEEQWNRHLNALLRSPVRFNTQQLLSMTNYPTSEYVGQFYAASVTLCRFLVEKGGREKLVAFVKDSMTGDVDSCLQRHYGFRNNAELDSAFKQYIDASRSSGALASRAEN